MKLLIVTQKIDRKDPVLGFFHQWLCEFALGGDIIAICLERGEAKLPENVKIYSLGKEEGVSRLTYVFRFLSIIWRERKNYDGVFVHMNPEYVILGMWLWKMLGRRVALWYNHSYGTSKARLAMRRADILCHTSRYAFTANTKKSIKMPAGIDTRVFKNTGAARKNRSLLYLGRMAPVKNIETLLEACLILDQSGEDFSLSLYGEALQRDEAYSSRLKRMADPLTSKNKVTFNPAVPNYETPPIYASHELFINLTPAGNFDKTVLEAMASGTLPVVSSRAFDDVLSESELFEERDPHSLARSISALLAASPEKKELRRRELGQYVLDNHDIRLLAKRIWNLYD